MIAEGHQRQDAHCREQSKDKSESQRSRIFDVTLMVTEISYLRVHGSYPAPFRLRSWWTSNACAPLYCEITALTAAVAGRKRTLRLDIPGAARRFHHGIARADADIGQFVRVHLREQTPRPSRLGHFRFRQISRHQ